MQITSGLPEGFNAGAYDMIVPLSAASISIGGASCYWYITEDGNDDGLELLEEAVQAEEAAAETETAAETEVAAGEESSSQDWWTSLFG